MPTSPDDCVVLLLHYLPLPSMHWGPSDTSVHERSSTDPVQSMVTLISMLPIQLMPGVQILVIRASKTVRLCDTDQMKHRFGKWER